MNSPTDFSGCELLVKHSPSSFFLSSSHKQTATDVVKLLLQQLKQQLQKYN